MIPQRREQRSPNLNPSPNGNAKIKINSKIKDQQPDQDQQLWTRIGRINSADEWMTA